MREDLSRILYDLTEDKFEYIWGDSIAAIDESEAGAEVRFACGKPRTFDLVVGTDGIHSYVRKLIFGDEEQIKHSLGCYI